MQTDKCKGILRTAYRYGGCLFHWLLICSGQHRAWEFAQVHEISLRKEPVQVLECLSTGTVQWGEAIVAVVA